MPLKRGHEVRMSLKRGHEVRISEVREVRVDAIMREINTVKTQMEAARSWCGMAIDRSARGEPERAEYAARRCNEAADAAEEALRKLEGLKPQESQLLLAMKCANTAKELTEKARASC